MLPKKYKNKYRRTSMRLKYWNYGNSAPYFITICTKNRRHFFGKIIKGKMHLSTIGESANREWLKTFELRADMNLEMGEYIIMPDHFHAIITIGHNPYNVGTKSGTAMHRGPNCFGPQSKNLASILRGFKSAVTTTARKNGDKSFSWQSLYHDKIIRDERAFRTISRYIINNPMKWEKDRLKKKNKK